MSSDIKWSQGLVQEVWFTFSRSEWIMKFPGGVRSREREAPGEEEVEPEVVQPL